MPSATYAAVFAKTRDLLWEPASWSPSGRWICDGEELISRSLYGALVDARTALGAPIATFNLIVTFNSRVGVPAAGVDPIAALSRWEKGRKHAEILAALQSAQDAEEPQS